MKRSVQEIVELVVFGAIALLIGTGLLWVAGWIFSGLGWLFQAVSGLVWRLLIVLVPIIVVAGLLYWLVTYLMNQRNKQTPPAAAPGSSSVGTKHTSGATAVPAVRGTSAVPSDPVPGDPLDSWHPPAAAVRDTEASPPDSAVEALATGLGYEPPVADFPADSTLADVAPEPSGAVEPVEPAALVEPAGPYQPEEAVAPLEPVEPVASVEPVVHEAEKPFAPVAPDQPVTEVDQVAEEAVDVDAPQADSWASDDNSRDSFEADDDRPLRNG